MENFVSQYWYELFLDDLPMWGMVGETLRDESGKMENVIIFSCHLYRHMITYFRIFCTAYLHA